MIYGILLRTFHISMTLQEYISILFLSNTRMRSYEAIITLNTLNYHLLISFNSHFKFHSISAELTISSNGNRIKNYFSLFFLLRFGQNFVIIGEKKEIFQLGTRRYSGSFIQSGKSLSPVHIVTIFCGILVYFESQSGSLLAWFYGLLQLTHS